MGKIVVFVLVVLGCTGCAGLPDRNPVPKGLVEQAQLPGIPFARYWADEAPHRVGFWEIMSKEEAKARFPATFGTSHTYLAISGGGPRGAFTAGFLNGWTAAGDRPDFTVVTGVSTGALIAPFAFLGSEYDHMLKEIYTNTSTNDILKKRSLIGMVTKDAVTDTTPLRQLMGRYLDANVMRAIAGKYKRGHTLIVVTTDLDAGRPVAWDIGRIAASGHPDALRLIHDVLIASAAIPAAFPPVMFEVEADGKIYDEMHVDGGVTSQLHLYPLSMDITEYQDIFDMPTPPTVYVLRNGYVGAPYEVIERKTLAIAASAMSTLMGSVSYGDMYRIYLEAERDGVEFNLAYLPSSFQESMSEPFDPIYMTKLYELGYTLASNGYDWLAAPPGYDTN